MWDDISWKTGIDPRVKDEPLLIVAEKLSSYTVFVDDHEEVELEYYICIQGTTEFTLRASYVNQYYKIISNE